MGVAGTIFEPNPPNSKNHKTIKDVQMTSEYDFLISLLVSDFKDQCGSVPFISVAVIGLYIIYS